jgi:hypothetical protein
MDLQVNLANLGIYPNDGTGDDLRSAFSKFNSNFLNISENSVTDGANVGTGAPVFFEKSDSTLQFRSISSANANMAVSYDSLGILFTVKDSINSLQEDLNPTLGGNLDTNGFEIFSNNNPLVIKSLNGNIALQSYSTVNNNYLPLELNALILSGNNTEDPGTSTLATHLGDGLTVQSDLDLNLVSLSGTVYLIGNVEATGNITAVNFTGNLSREDGEPLNILSKNNSLILQTYNSSNNNYLPLELNALILSGNNAAGPGTSTLATYLGDGLIVQSDLDLNLVSLQGSIYLTGNVEATANITAVNFIGDVTGQVSDISNHQLSDLSNVSDSIPEVGQALIWNGFVWEPGTNVNSLPTNYDFGLISGIRNPFDLLLQFSNIDFGSIYNPPSEHLDLGTIGNNPETLYRLTSSVNSIAEGDSFTVSLTTSNIPNGTQIPYTISGLTLQDIDSLTGSFTVVNSVSTKIFTVLVADVVNESKIFTITLDNNPTISLTVEIVNEAEEYISGDIDGNNADTSYFGIVVDGGAPLTTDFSSVADGGTFPL